MKKISIEEKARRYDEAIERAGERYNEEYTSTLERSTLAYVFPELKESKGERIRKDIIGYLALYKDEIGEEYESWIAWLEKQGELVKSLSKGLDNAHDRIDELIQKNNSLMEQLEKNQGEKKSYASETMNEKGDFDNGFTRMVEKEQKPADKVEPKFKVGDWIVNKGHSYLIADIDYEQRRYLFEIGGYTHEQLNWEYIKNADNKYHLWTIQDAKDGDVLSWDDSKCIAIFKNIYDEDSFNSYGFVGGCTGTFESRMSYHDIEGTHPATKEQRNHLFQKMKEAGYEWDAEKKKLRKIEDEQKPWSEEDEKMYAATIFALAGFMGNEDKSDWLKSLKGRYTWKPSDEQTKALNYVINLMASSESPKENDYYYNVFKDLREQLKKLREE